MLKNGLYLVKRKSVKMGSLIDHYAVLDIGNILELENVDHSFPVIAHNIFPQPVLQYYKDTVNNGVPNWEIVQICKDTSGAKKRFNEALRCGNYNLLFNNCEHFARHIVSKERNSKQLQIFLGISICALALYLYLKDDAA